MTRRTEWPEWQDNGVATEEVGGLDPSRAGERPPRKSKYRVGGRRTTGGSRSTARRTAEGEGEPVDEGGPETEPRDPVERA